MAQIGNMASSTMLPKVNRCSPKRFTPRCQPQILETSGIGKSELITLMSDSFPVWVQKEYLQNGSINPKQVTEKLDAIASGKERLANESRILEICRDANWRQSIIDQASDDKDTLWDGFQVFDRDLLQQQDNWKRIWLHAIFESTGKSLEELPTEAILAQFEAHKLWVEYSTGDSMRLLQSQNDSKVSPIIALGRNLRDDRFQVLEALLDWIKDTAAFGALVTPLSPQQHAIEHKFAQNNQISCLERTLTFKKEYVAPYSVKHLQARSYLPYGRDRMTRACRKLGVPIHDFKNLLKIGVKTYYKIPKDMVPKDKRERENQGPAMTPTS